MFTFLLVVQALIAAVLVGVILMQQSEGGGLGMGGSPSGLMSARGAANFLTRATGILAASFVTLSILLAVVATQRATPTTIDTSLAKQPLPTAPAAPAPAVPLAGAPATTTPAAVTPAPVAAAPKVDTARKPATTAPKPVVTKAADPVIKVVPTQAASKPAASTSTPAPIGPSNSN